MASNPTSSASLGPSPGIKTHSSPAVFPTTLSLPLPLTLHTAPPLVPYAAPSSAYSLPASPPTQNRYDAASGKSAAARPAPLICSTPRQHCLLDRLTRTSTLRH